MTRSSWGKMTLAMLIGGLLLIVGSVIIIDPFEVYHKASFFIPPIENGTQNYSNAGIAKSYEYDSVIIGSSMTENFRPSQLDELLGGHFIKLPINAGSPYNNKQMMDLAFGTREIKTVVYGVDIESFTYFYKTPKCEMPDYLYDDDIFNDTQYWFNQSVLATFIPKCLATLGQQDEAQRDTMYTWGEKYPYGKEAALRGKRLSSEHIEQTPLEKDPTLSQQSMLNVEHNIIPYVESHPDTEFIFFFPPYALVRWDNFYESGNLHYHHVQKEAIIKRLLPYKNVRIYDFQAESDWILNLDHYIDDGHYGPWINDAMIEAIAEDRYRITEVSQAQKNDAAIRYYIDQLRRHGTWPDSFDLIPLD